MSASGAVSLSENAIKVLERRYLARDENGDPTETHEEMFRRVARNVSSAEQLYGATEPDREKWEKLFFNLMTELRFLPNSPTLMNAGTAIQQLSACFVLPVEDSMDGIFESLKHAALIHKSGGGTGFSFSRIRPQQDTVNSTKGVSSGPLSFMNVFDAATETIKQGGRRRGANMAILRVDHPDILDFIASKNETNRLNNFNISVAITDTFMTAIANGTDYDLINPRTRKPVGKLEAAEVFSRIVECAWKTGEPGIVFIDRINQYNPVPHAGDIESTNPCGEQPLLPYESCNLGSINLARMTRGSFGAATLDHDRVRETATLAVRFLDNVIDVNRYPLPQIEKLTRAHRKIGLGVMGFADMLVQMGIPYDSDEAVAVSEETMQVVHECAREASHELAVERGPFPEFAKSRYAARGERPLRNATVSTIAPTGSISIIADTSSGIEPLFALAFERNVLDGSRLVEVNPLFARVAADEGFGSETLMAKIAKEGSVHDCDEVPARWREIFKTAHDITPEAHIRIQAAFQKYTDNAVSKTVNFANDATRDDVRVVFEQAYRSGCKGVTIYRDGSRDHQVLSTGKTATASESPAKDAQPSHKKTPKPRPAIMKGATQRVSTGCGNMYVTINENGIGPFEIFAQIGKAGGCAASQTEAIGRLISLALRAGVDPKAVAKQLKGVRCPSPAWNKGEKVYSCADGIGQALEKHLNEFGSEAPLEEAPPGAERLAGTCECGGMLEYEGGCVVCRCCGFSRC